MGFPDLGVAVPTNIGQGGFLHETHGAVSEFACCNSTEAGRTNGGVTTRLVMIGFGTLSLTLTAGWYLVLFQVARWAIGRWHP
jgi:hypothetical protein